jgi:serine/threonine protein kinase
MGGLVPPSILEGLQLQRISSDLTIDIESLPKQYINGAIRIGEAARCTIQYKTIQNRGGYGSIYLANRKDCSGTQEICVKIPHEKGFSLCPEAIIQCIVFHTLEAAKIRGAVPRVFDIFQYAGETRFSMSFIQGQRAIDYIIASATPEITLLQYVAQVALLLGFLEHTVHFDHRDLKADNTWIRCEPIDYRVCIGQTTWHVAAPFQVVLLDFGFSCLGNADGYAAVSLSDGILPRVDPCPKEGRDLFQLISSLWSVPQIRALIGRQLSGDIELLLSYKNRPYSGLITKTLELQWVYLLVSDFAFKHPPLHPIALLEMLSIKYPQLCIHSE